TAGCVLTCTFGEAPSVLITEDLPGKPSFMGMPAATMMDMIPIDNVPTFGMCSSLENPEVASATAAAEGVLTPMPCVPVITDPWDPPSELVSYAGIPLATVESRCLCDFGGEISVDAPLEMVASTEG